MVVETQEHPAFRDAFAGTHTTPLAAGAFRPFGIRSVVGPGGVRVRVEETVDAVFGAGQLRSFRARHAARRSVLVVAPLSGAFPYLLRDLVVALLGVADQVAVTDWPDARYLPLDRGAFGFDANCLETAAMIAALGPGCHVLGVCQGAIPALVASALVAQEGRAPASLSLLGGPIDPACHPTRLDRVLAAAPAAGPVADMMETVPAALPGAGRRVFPHRRQMQAFGFYLWRQALTGGELPLKLVADDGDDPLRFPLARLCWDMMDIPEEFFLENVDRVFRQRMLVGGGLHVAGHRVELAALDRTLLLTVEGEDDDIAAPGQTEAAHPLCPNLPAALHRHRLVQGAGHFSLFYGGRMRRDVLPALAHAMAFAEAS